MTLGDVCEKYLAYLTNPGTIKSTREHLNAFMAFAGKKARVSSLRVHHVNDYLNTKQWAEATRGTAVSRIVSALNWAEGEGLIDPHKVRYARGKKPRIIRRVSELTTDQQDRLEAAAYPALRLMLRALRESGCRPKELCSATIDKVDLKSGVMMVPNKVSAKTGVKFRPIYMSPRLVELVKGSIGNREDGFVFLHSRGGPWNRPDIQHSVRKIRIALGMPKGTVTYAYRGKYSSDAINNSNVNPALVAKLLGHSDLTMLLRHYFKESPEAMREAVEKIMKDGK